MRLRSPATDAQRCPKNHRDNEIPRIALLLTALYQNAVCGDPTQAAGPVAWVVGEANGGQ
jgi:hypothetical protein